MMISFFKGVFLGFSLVAPIGPVNAFILNRATQFKTVFSIWPLLAMTILCDAILILAAVLGVEILPQNVAFQRGMMGVGSLFLFYMGWKTWKNGTLSSEERPQEWTTLGQMVYIMSIVFLNPHALLDSFVVLGSVAAELPNFEKTMFASGCIMIDISWFLALAVCGVYTSKLKGSLTILKFLNRGSAFIMFLVAFDLGAKAAL